MERRKTERRIDTETAQLFKGTEFDRRDHEDAECQADPGCQCCAKCGRPMTHFEGLIYRAL